MKISTLKSTTAPMIYVYGQQGRGKTTFASKFPNPLFIPLERGIPSGIEVAAVEGIDSFEAYMDAMREIYGDANGYRTLVIDGTEVLEARLIEYLCAKHGWKS